MKSKLHFPPGYKIEFNENWKGNRAIPRSTETLTNYPNRFSSKGLSYQHFAAAFLRYQSRPKRLSEAQIAFLKLQYSLPHCPLSNPPTEVEIALLKLQRSHPHWSFYPSEPKVAGFLGTGKIFIVSAHHPLDYWHYLHEHRRALYDCLRAYGGDCHITDLYKKRRPIGDFRNGVDSVRHADFREHLEVFHEEVRLLKPTKILAMGRMTAYMMILHTEYAFEEIENLGGIHVQGNEHRRIPARNAFMSRLRSAIRRASVKCPGLIQKLLQPPNIAAILVPYRSSRGKESRRLRKRIERSPVVEKGRFR